jgi:acyl-CoA reductase-like NAD-dependent aldehyde dehydrogenase
VVDHGQRRVALRQLADTLSDTRAMASLLDLIVADTGFTRANVRRREFEYPSLFLREAAACRSCLTESQVAVEEREPLGRVACGLPVNAPIYSLGKVLGPAYLTGNELICRLPSRLRRSGSRIRELVSEHLPGVEFADAEAMSGDAFLADCTRDPRVQAVVLFGEDTWIGPVRARARDSGKKLIFEGPGNDPAVVMEGADLKRAAAEIALGCLNNGGQSCSATKRVFVQDSVYTPFVEALIERVSRAQFGLPDEEGVIVGPIVSARIKERIRAHTEDAKANGARYLYGDGSLDRDSIFRPSVVAASPKLRMVREETFYPVIPVVRFSTTDELVAFVDDSPYGLNACVFGDCPPEILQFICMRHKDVRVDAYPIAPEFVERIMTIGGFKNSALVDEWVHEEHRSARTRSLTAGEYASKASRIGRGGWDISMRHVTRQGRFALEMELSVQTAHEGRS